MYIDKKLTQRVQKWLKSPEKYVSNIEEGATLLLKFTRNQFLYASALRNPERMKDKVAYELKKFLRLQLDGTTAAAVAKMVPTVMQSVRESLSCGVPEFEPARAEAAEAAGKPPRTNAAGDSVEGSEGGSEAEKPEGVSEAEKPEGGSEAEKPEGGSEAEKRLGRRADHDRLPADIQALWDANGKRWHKMRQAYNELQSLIDAGGQPCDLYEKLKLLDELDKAYRADMAKYDAAAPATESPVAMNGAGTEEGTVPAAAAPSKEKRASKK